MCSKEHNLILSQNLPIEENNQRQGNIIEFEDELKEIISIKSINIKEKSFDSYQNNSFSYIDFEEINKCKII